MADKKVEEPEEKFEQWLHAQITDPVLWDHFEKMAKNHQGGRSAFIRWLIEREWARLVTDAMLEPKKAHFAGSGIHEYELPKDGKKLLKAARMQKTTPQGGNKGSKVAA